jgi:D-alanine-D-alanine ligase
MKKIAVIGGGNSGEYEVSLNSAEMVMQTIDRKKYEPYKIIIRGKDWHAWEGTKKYPIDKNDFSFTKGKKKITFDVAYIIVHGTPGEDGKLQGYLDLMGIPYTSPDVLVSALTMNKYLTKKICKAAKIPVAKSILLKAHESIIDVDKISEKLKLPCFVKPNNGGSSVATTKAYTKQELADGIEAAFEHDHEVIVEQYIKGREVTCGVYFDGNSIQTLPVTEIIPHNDFFDYEAKYQGKSDEITPAKLDKKLYKKVQDRTAEIYELLNISGLVRIDFIIKNDTPYFMEVNTVPGFSKASIVPQQIRAAGLKEKDVLSLLIELAIQRKKA